MKPVTITWPIATKNGVATSQTLGGAGSLVINGSLVNRTLGLGAIFYKMARVASLTSALGGPDLRGVNFTITGTLNGQVVSETLAGPNTNATVETDQLFNSVTSITTSAAVGGSGVTAGMGTTGRTDWILYNYHNTANALSVQYTIAGNAGSLDLDFCYTSNDPTTLGLNNNLLSFTGVTEGIVIPQSDNAEAFTTVINDGTANAGTSYQATLRDVCRYYCMVVTAQSDDLNGQAVFNFIQQGIL